MPPFCSVPSLLEQMTRTLTAQTPSSFSSHGSVCSLASSYPGFFALVVLSLKPAVLWELAHPLSSAEWLPLLFSHLVSFSLSVCALTSLAAIGTDLMMYLF